MKLWLVPQRGTQDVNLPKFYYRVKPTSMIKKNITVEPQDAGKRLDVFLTENYPIATRSQWQKKIKSGGVSINGEKPAVHQFLKVGDEIKIEKDKETKKEKSINTKLPKYKLLEETKDYLIVEKPAGALTHTDGKVPGLADAIVKDFPEIKKVGEEYRWGIVHRLDKSASGLLVIARTKKFFEYIKERFAERKINKIYLALVYGEIPKDEDVLQFAISRGSEGRMAARPKDDEGREATTRIKILKRYKNYTYLEARIETGRTHQIRTHLLAYGYGIVGDKIYKPRRQKIKNPGVERLFLHSHILGFENMEGEYVEYKSNLPKELKDVLKKIKIVL